MTRFFKALCVCILRCTHEAVAQVVQEGPVLANFHEHVQYEQDVPRPQQRMQVTSTATCQGFFETHEPFSRAVAGRRHKHQLVDSLLIITLIRKTKQSLAMINKSSCTFLRSFPSLSPSLIHIHIPFHLHFPFLLISLTLFLRLLY